MNTVLRPLALALLPALLPHGVAAAEVSRPNIIVILADDLGFGSIGCFGADPSLVRTPNLDRLAADGRRFTNANTPGSVCTPTRYAVITGRYCWRTRLNHGGVSNTLDPLLIEPTRPTLASMLQRHGYRTAMVGKWHLGYGTRPRVDFTQPLVPGPRELGFDYEFAVPQNHGDASRVFVENGRVLGLRSSRLQPIPGKPGQPGKIGLDAPERDDPNTMAELTNRAIAWLQQPNPAAHPFFLYFAPVAVHAPITPSKETTGTSKAGPYGDFIHDLDRSVGRLMDALHNLRAADNTLVIFTSDNGGELGGTPDRPNRVAIQAGLALNAPHRGGKHEVWQGGFAVPFIARWPGRIPANTTSNEMIGLVDLFATIAAVVGETALDPKTTAPDSYNMLPALLGDSHPKPLRDHLILQGELGVYAIRSGPWKWIEGVPVPRRGGVVIPGKHDPRSAQLKPQLYNLETDIAETRDVAAEHPEIVAQLSTALRKYRTQSRE